MSSRFRAAPSRRATPVGAACSWRSRSRPVCRAAVGLARDARSASGDRVRLRSAEWRRRPDACSLETPRTCRLQNHSPPSKAASVRGREAHAALRRSLGPASDPSITPTNTTVNGDTASVAFAGRGDGRGTDNQLRRAASRHPRTQSSPVVDGAVGEPVCKEVGSLIGIAWRPLPDAVQHRGRACLQGAGGRRRT